MHLKNQKLKKVKKQQKKKGEKTTEKKDDKSGSDKSKGEEEKIKRPRKNKKTEMYTRPVTAKKIMDLEVDVKKICGGDTHTLLLTNDNSVYAWGSNRYGQLGLGKPIGDHVEPYPQKITFFDENDIKIVDISSGESHCLALSDKGELYGFGFASTCRLGNVKEENEVTIPTLITFTQLKDKRIVAIDSGTMHNILLVQKEE
jgi:alpha-tubulin suppressor-like RCC1 family protein